MYVNYDELNRNLNQFGKLNTGDSFCTWYRNNMECGIKIPPVQDFDDETKIYNAIIFFENGATRLIWIDIDIVVAIEPMSIYFGEN